MFTLNYRYPKLGNYPPLNYLIDEMVQIADGLYLGQAAPGHAQSPPEFARVSRVSMDWPTICIPTQACDASSA